jgi:hypothetical protein
MEKLFIIEDVLIDDFEEELEEARYFDDDFHNPKIPKTFKFCV